MYISKKIYNTSENITDKRNPQKLYAYMLHIYSNAESPGRNDGDSSQLTNWILDSGDTCKMTPDISYFIPHLLMETYKYIKVVDGQLFTAKQTG